MKRLLLCLCATLSLHASAETLQFWKFSGGKTENAALQAWVDEWNKMNPGKTVELRFFPFKDYDSGPVLTTAFATGKGPDVWWIAQSYFSVYADSGLAADLTDLFTPEVRDDFLPAAIKSVTINGKLVAVPIEEEPVALFYNKDIFDRLGLTVPKTWDELLTVCEKLKSADVIPIVVETTPGGYENFTWYPFLWSTGANALDENYSKAIFDSSGAAKALDLWRTLIQKGYAPKVSSPDNSGQITTTAFGRGQAAMQVIGCWAVKQLKEDLPNLHYGVATVPVPEGAKPVTVYGGWTQMVNANSKRLTDAKAFTAWMWIQGTQHSMEWTTQVKTNFSTRKTVLNSADAFYQAHPVMKYFRDDILPGARPEPRFSPEVVKIISDALQSAMFRDTPGATAAAAAQKQLQGYLSTR